MPSSDEPAIHPDLSRHLVPLYGEAAARQLVESAGTLAQRHGLKPHRAPADIRPDQRFCLLITYGDTIQRPAEAPLRTLRDFLLKRLGGTLTAVHVLPFYPHSSDDGFSVMDYRAVDRHLGGWADIEALGEDYALMFDVVLNHVSRKSLWFANYLADTDPGRGYFIEMDPAADLRQVVRPRSTPLLTEVPTPRGTRHLWTTFSEDQIDLDFSNPGVLAEFIDIIFGYVARGARLLRLDAVAFLWKDPATACIHLPQTHALIKFLHRLLAVYAPGVMLVTETNVPHAENISYLVDGDEAHAAYQFALPPLVLHTLLSGNAARLRDWARDLPELPPGCHFLNFTASHDGVGLRAVESILAPPEIQALVDAAHRQGGFVSTRAGSDGLHHPYELNISYFDMLGGTDDVRIHIARFVCSQAIALALRGLPALYFHSLTASGNDLAGVERSGRYRTINRRKWDSAELEARLDDASSPHARVFTALRSLLSVRAGQPAFHPDGGQAILDLGERFFALRRSAPGGGQEVLCISNVTGEPQTLGSETIPFRGRRDLISGRETGNDPALAPYQTLWFSG